MFFASNKLFLLRQTVWFVACWRLFAKRSFCDVPPRFVVRNASRCLVCACRTSLLQRWQWPWIFTVSFETKIQSHFIGCILRTRKVHLYYIIMSFVCLQGDVTRLLLRLSMEVHVWRTFHVVHFDLRRQLVASSCDASRWSLLLWSRLLGQLRQPGANHLGGRSQFHFTAWWSRVLSKAHLWRFHSICYNS